MSSDDGRSSRCACSTDQRATAEQSLRVRYTGTLKKINDSGEIRIGYRENSPPFAFLDAQRKPLGYSLDLCEIVVEEIAAELAKDIRVIRRPVTPENRFDLVTSGEVDLECGSTTNNRASQEHGVFADMSSPHQAAGAAR